MAAIGTRMPAQVLAALACEERGFEFLGCETLADGSSVARATNEGGERLEALGRDEIAACWHLARVADGQSA